MCMPGPRLLLGVEVGMLGTSPGRYTPRRYTPGSYTTWKVHSQEGTPPVPTSSGGYGSG